MRSLLAALRKKVIDQAVSLVDEPASTRVGQSNRTNFLVAFAVLMDRKAPEVGDVLTHIYLSACCILIETGRMLLAEHEEHAHQFLATAIFHVQYTYERLLN